MNQVKFVNINTGNYDYYHEINSERFDQLMYKFDNNITPQPEDLCYFIIPPCDDSRFYTAIDNTSGFVWTEDFETIEECIAYFSGEDLDEIANIREKKNEITGAHWDLV